MKKLKMNVFKMSNSVFELGLDAQEMAVYAYLCSIQSKQSTLLGDTVKVKQATIGLKCGIKAVQTVAKIITRLCEQGLVEVSERSVKQNNHKGTYIYFVWKQPTTDCFFFVYRQVFGRLNPRQLMVYLFISKSFSTTLRDCWNSYNDIARQVNMKRETVIQTVNELVEMHLIIRIQRKSKENNRVYVDNHYQLVGFIRGKIKKVQPQVFHPSSCIFLRLNQAQNKYIINTILSHLSANVKGFIEENYNIFFGRGSPSDYTHL